MSIKSTLSFHNDTTWSLEHDKRESKKLPDNVNPEDCKYNVYWKGNTTLEKFYEKYFEKSFQEQEMKKKPADRYNGTYLEKISELAAEKEKLVRDLRNRHAPYSELRKVNRFTKPAYQVVITIGNCNDNPEFKHGGEKEDVAKEILTKYMNTFEERNPSMKLVCGAVHCDEGDRYDADGNLEKVGGNLHLHLTYCPVAVKCSRGQRVQNSLSQALREMGIESDKAKNPVTCKFETAQIKWQYRERDFLTGLCKEHDIHIFAKEVDEVHRSVDDYQRKKEMDYINESKRQLKERSDALDIREQTIQAILQENPSVEEIESIINENVEVVQRNDALEKRENTNQDFIQSLREEYFRESAALWNTRKNEKDELKKLIKEMSENKRFDEKKYKHLMNSIYYSNELLIVKLFKFIYSLFFRYKLRNEEQQLQKMVELNKKMKEKSKEIVEAGKELTASFKTKNLNEIFEALDKWDYTIGKIEDDICHKINIDMEKEKLKREAYEERMSRREEGDGKRTAFYFDDLR